MMVRRNEWWRYHYEYPNDFGHDLNWCLDYDLKLIRDYVRYAFEDQRAGKAAITEGMH